MDESITITVTLGPFIATHEESYCPLCQDRMVAGETAITVDTGDGPRTMCWPCGGYHVTALLAAPDPRRAPTCALCGCTAGPISGELISSYVGDVHEACARRATEDGRIVL